MEAYHQVTDRGATSYHGPLVSLKHGGKNFLQKVFRSVRIESTYRVVRDGKVVTKEVDKTRTLVRVGRNAKDGAALIEKPLLDGPHRHRLFRFTFELGLDGAEWDLLRERIEDRNRR